MCVLILHHRVIPGFPVVVAANRDEARDRPSEPPRVWPGGFLAPRDVQAGGTWIGLNRHGVVAAITNRSREPRDPHRPSRGLLVLEALGAPSARAAAARVARLGFATPQNPCNLLLADAEDALLVIGGETMSDRTLAPGTHVLSNEHELGELGLRDLAPPLALDAALAALGEVLRDHGERAPGYALCKHGERYGTVSSALVAVAANPRGPHRFGYREGLPCQGEHRELMSELAALRKT
jgi:uncharacterized protein with NRDE domain